MGSPARLRPERVEDGLWDSNQRHSGDGGGESQSKRQELTFEFCSALAEVMQLGTDAFAQVGTSAPSTCHTSHATRRTPHAKRRKSHLLASALRTSNLLLASAASASANDNRSSKSWLRCFSAGTCVKAI
jgi:hypothetical protein